MTIQIDKYTFEGPDPLANAALKNNSGIYAILKKVSDDGFNVIDIGESGEVKDRIDTHDRKSCWKDKGGNYVAVYYTLYMDHKDRVAIEQALRKLFNPPCGDK